MSHTETSQPKKKKWIFIILLLLLLLFFGIVVSQFLLQPRDNTDRNNALTLEDHKWEKSVKHGKFTFSSNLGSVSTGEFWFDAPKYRITWYRDDGSVRLHMISQDGVHLYFADPEKQTSEIAYFAPQMHLSIFNGPDEYVTKEISSEDGSEVTAYEIDTVWNIENASQEFYLKDLKIYRQNNQIDKIITRTSSSKAVSEDDLAVSTYQITVLDFPAQIDPNIFELPYQLEQ